MIEAEYGRNELVPEGLLEFFKIMINVFSSITKGHRHEWSGSHLPENQVCSLPRSRGQRTDRYLADDVVFGIIVIAQTEHTISQVRKKVGLLLVLEEPVIEDLGVVYNITNQLFSQRDKYRLVLHFHSRRGRRRRTRWT